MGIVNILKFDEYAGAIITDEEDNFQVRRTFFRDNLYRLIDQDIAKKLNIEVIYGGVGDASLHHEIYESVAREIRQDFKAKKKKKSSYKTVEAVGRLVIKSMNVALKRKANNRLRYLFGFNADDLNRGYFIKDGQKYEIKQEKIIKKALKISTKNEEAAARRGASEDHSLIIGFDSENKLCMYNIKAECSVLSHVSGGFDTVGTGKYASGLSFAKCVGRKEQKVRNSGMDHAEGMVELILSAIYAAEYCTFIGGLFHISYLNGEKMGEKVVEYDELHVKLATEIVHALHARLIDRPTSIKLIRDLMFKGVKLDSVESALYSSAQDPMKLDTYLRGYKLDIPDPGAFHFPATRKKVRKTKMKAGEK
ncbi:hypothetical protein KAJ27_16915 [bacterium]|nr:hypothetical protein [bacterium]